MAPPTIRRARLSVGAHHTAGFGINRQAPAIADVADRKTFHPSTGSATFTANISQDAYLLYELDRFTSVPVWVHCTRVRCDFCVFSDIY